MVTKTVSNSITGIIAPMNTKTAEKGNCSQDQAKKLSFAQKQEMQCLCGAGSSTAAANAVLTAPYSETKASIDPATLYTRRMKLLIASGLVAGITPMSERRRSPQATLDFALSQLGGNDSTDEPEED